MCSNVIVSEWLDAANEKVKRLLNTRVSLLFNNECTFFSSFLFFSIVRMYAKPFDLLEGLDAVRFSFNHI